VNSRGKEQYIKAVRQGQDDARNGRLIKHEDLIKDLESRLADLDR
jgi:predicted transcriptional regulator